MAKKKGSNVRIGGRGLFKAGDGYVFYQHLKNDAPYWQRVLETANNAFSKVVNNGNTREGAMTDRVATLDNLYKSERAKEIALLKELLKGPDSNQAILDASLDDEGATFLKLVNSVLNLYSSYQLFIESIKRSNLEIKLKEDKIKTLEKKFHYTSLADYQNQYIERVMHDYGLKVFGVIEGNGILYDFLEEKIDQQVNSTIPPDINNIDAAKLKPLVRNFLIDELLKTIDNMEKADAKRFEKLQESETDELKNLKEGVAKLRIQQSREMEIIFKKHTAVESEFKVDILTSLNIERDVLTIIKSIEDNVDEIFKGFTNPKMDEKRRKVLKKPMSETLSKMKGSLVAVDGKSTKSRNYTKGMFKEIKLRMMDSLAASMNFKFKSADFSLEFDSKQKPTTSHVGQYANLIDNTTAYLGIEIKDPYGQMRKIVEDTVAGASDRNSEERAKSFHEFEKKIQQLDPNSKFIKHSSIKSSNMGTKIMAEKGFTGPNRDLSGMEAAFRLSGIKDVDMLMNLIYQFRSGAIYSSNNEMRRQLMEKIAQSIGHLLFDDLYTIGETPKGSLDAIHVFELNEAVIPLSVLLKLLRDTLQETFILTKENPLKGAFQLELHQKGILYPGGSTEGTTIQRWNNQRAVASDSVKIEVHFFQGLKDLLNKIGALT